MDIQTYYKYLDNNDKEWYSVDETFLKSFENSEMFMEDEILEKIRDKKVSRSSNLSDIAVQQLASQVGNINLNVILNIDNLEGNEEDLDEWFKSFERVYRSKTRKTMIKVKRQSY